jgi:hypothetical protein
MMKTAKIKDINQPVNEGNLDKSTSYIYSTNDTYIYIRRPLVLTPTEKANVAKNDTINGLLKYEWDGNEFYSGLYFGDGAGPYNDYGQTVYLQDKIHIPEIYPAPGFKEGTVFLEIKQGVTTLWGEIDTDQLPDFYKTYAYPTGQDKFTKDPDTDIWKSPEGKLPASDLAEDRAVYIQMRTFINGTGGTVHTGTVPLSKGGKRFILTSAYPGNWIGVDIRRRQKGTNQITYNMSYEYRSRFIYYLLKEGEQYFLVDFADRTKRMPLEIKEYGESREFVSLANHLRYHDVGVDKFQWYYDKYLRSEGEGICNLEECSNDTRFWSLTQGYQDGFCSIRCFNLSPEKSDQTSRVLIELHKDPEFKSRLRERASKIFSDYNSSPEGIANSLLQISIINSDPKYSQYRHSYGIKSTYKRERRVI